MNKSLYAPSSATQIIPANRPQYFIGQNTSSHHRDCWSALLDYSDHRADRPRYPNPSVGGNGREQPCTYRVVELSNDVDHAFTHYRVRHAAGLFYCSEGVQGQAIG